MTDAPIHTALEAVEAARQTMHRLMRGEQVGAGDGGTFMVSTPRPGSIDAACAALAQEEGKR
jgi:hypothetical protein